MISTRFVFALGFAACVVAIAGCSSPSPEAAPEQLTEVKPAAGPTATSAAPRLAGNEPIQDAKEESSTKAAPQAEPQKQVVLKPVVPAATEDIPEVFLSSDHSALCRVRVGDDFPEATLEQLSGGEASLSSLRGAKATVILLWHPDRWMSETALRDLQQDVITKYDKSKVAVMGIAVETPPGEVKDSVSSTKAEYAQLLDGDGKFFAKVGMVRLPRIYVLDSAGKIVWFDLEFSESTRRELGWTLELLAGAE